MRVEIDSNHISANAAAAIVAAMKLNDGWHDAATGQWLRIVGTSYYPAHAMPDGRYIYRIYVEDAVGRRWVGTDWGTGLIEYLRSDDVDYWKRTLYD